MSIAAGMSIFRKFERLPMARRKVARLGSATAPLETIMMSTKGWKQTRRRWIRFSPPIQGIYASESPKLFPRGTQKGVECKTKKRVLFLSFFAFRVVFLTKSTLIFLKCYMNAYQFMTLIFSCCLSYTGGYLWWRRRRLEVVALPLPIDVAIINGPTDCRIGANDGS